MQAKHVTIHSYWLMFVATVITVGIVTSSQLVTNRIGLLLDRQASELLAADLVLLSGREIDTKYQAVAREHGLKVSQSVSLRTAPRSLRSSIAMSSSRSILRDGRAPSDRIYSNFRSGPPSMQYISIC